MKEIIKKLIIYSLFLISKLLPSHSKKFSLNHINKILIIMTAGIGNMLLFIPALWNIRYRFPHAKIDLLVGPRGTMDLVSECPYLDRILIFDTKEPLFKRIKRLQKEKYDLIMVSYTSQNVQSLLITFMLMSPYRIGYNTQGMGFIYNIKVPLEEKHEVEVNLDLVHSLGMKVVNKGLEMWLTAEDREFAAEFFKNYGIKKDEWVIGLHPGAYKDFWFKRWDKERFAKLGDILTNEFKARVILFGGSDEVGLCEQIKDLMLCSPIIVAGKTTIRQTAALIERCHLFISNDSGLMHLATAVKTKVVAIFGPTIPKKNAPYQGENIIIRKELPCSPCYQMYKRFKCSHLQCLNLITVEDVIKIIRGENGNITY